MFCTDLSRPVVCTLLPSPNDSNICATINQVELGRLYWKRRRVYDQAGESFYERLKVQVIQSHSAAILVDKFTSGVKTAAEECMTEAE